ncbi:MAG: hypothetical protein O2789_04115 [Actinomycetota bacterium]|nr:hypothetical protein [Actinomycetota bacterium]
MLAGSDLPPPAGFLWVVLGVVLLTLLIGFAIPWLWGLQSEHGPGRVLTTCLGAGASLGVLIGVLVTLTNRDESTSSSPGVAAYAIWLGVLLFVGGVNGTFVGGVTVLARPKE